MPGIFQDLRYAARALRERPAYSLTAVFTILLGIAAATVVYSVFDSVILNPLQYRDSERWVSIQGTLPERGETNLGVSGPDFLDLRRQLTSYSTLEVFSYYGLSLDRDGELRDLNAQRVTPTLLSELGVAPALGRTFLPQESEDDKVVVVSDRLFRRAFGGDPAVVGSQARIDGEEWTIVGVMPPQFYFPWPENDLWLPVRLDAETNRARRGYLMVGKLKPGVSLESAQQEATLAAQALATSFPEANQGRGLHLQALKETAVGSVRAPLTLVLAAVALFLLIACANVANLTLARSLDRREEVAARLALGASRGQLVRASLAESTLLAVVGGGLGVLVASWAVNGLSAVTSFLPRATEIHLDGQALLVAAVLVVLAGPVFGLLPAFQLARLGERGLLRSSSRRSGDGASTSRLRRGLIAVEIALSLVLLVGAGLMLRSWQRLSSLDPGFEPQGALAVQLFVFGPKYREPAAQQGFFDRLLTEVRDLPGVAAAGAGNALPLSPIQAPRVDLKVDGRAEAEKEKTAFGVVTPGWLEALGRRLSSGRAFDADDRAETTKVALLNETAARRFFPGEEALGKRVQLGGPQGQWCQVVGVVGDVRQTDLEASPAPEAYVPLAQQATGVMTLFVRAQGDPRALVRSVERKVWQVDSTQAVYRSALLADLVAESTLRRRFFTGALLAFAGAALVLAAVGLYGVISYAVAQRRREIAVRLALGAVRGEIQSMVLRDGALLAALGLAAGLGLSVALGGAVRSLLFEVSPFDPLTLAAVSGALFLTALLASLLPARRAAEVPPVLALKEG